MFTCKMSAGQLKFHGFEQSKESIWAPIMNSDGVTFHKFTQLDFSYFSYLSSTELTLALSNGSEWLG